MQIHSFPLLIFLCMVCFANMGYGQQSLTKTGKILYSNDDSLAYTHIVNGEKKLSVHYSWQHILQEPEKTWKFNNNNAGWPGQHIFSTGKDSIVFESGTEQSFRFNVTNGKDTIVAYVSFVNSIPAYTREYQAKHNGKVSYEIPRGFELINIILALTDSGRMDGSLIQKNTRYYDKMISHFSKYEQHPVVRFASRKLSGQLKTGYYIEARTWGLRYDLDNHKLVPHPTYPEQWGQNFWSLYTKELQDFAKQSEFEKFYARHQRYYRRLIKKEKKYTPVLRMWQWLEKEFPGRYQSYKIIFSPLIKGAHNTDRLSGNGFEEIIMYVNSTEAIKKDKRAIMEGRMSGIVFTEIDHNYVNPVSAQYKKEIDSIFADRKKWTGTGGDAVNYNTAMSVFNEYMTHALFCLYASSLYSKEEFSQINAEREVLMTDRRKFIKFKEFNEALKTLYQDRKQNQTVADLYPEILKWAKGM